MQRSQNHKEPEIKEDITSVVIVGAGGAGREVIESLKEQNKYSSRKRDILGFVDDNKSLHGRIMNGYPVLGGLEWLKKYQNDNLSCVVAIGVCEIRQALVEKLRKIGANFCNIIHPSVIMSDLVELGQGVMICAGCVLTVNIKIGDHVYVNTNSTISHDAMIGNYSTINPAATINGNDRLGEGVYVGSGATLIQDISVGNWSTIGAGAVVTKDIPDSVVAVGVPAKVIKFKDKPKSELPRVTKKNIETTKVS